MLLVFAQPGKISFNEKKLKNNSGQDRGSHKVNEFAKKYGLGNPIAGTFYLAEWDSYVPKVHERLFAGKK